MAKKRKGARPTTKASAKKKPARKAAPRRTAPKQPSGLEKPGMVDFKPLKQQIGKHIARLESAKGAVAQDERIVNTLRILRQVTADLSSACLPTMELQTS